MRRRNATPRNEREAQAREQSLAALALMRRENLALEAAASSQGIDPKTVLRYVGTAIRQKDAGGRYVATAHDNIPRTLHFVTRSGKVVVTVEDSRIASRIAKYMNAVRAYVRRGDVTALEAFKGDSFQASEGLYSFETDPDILAQLGDARQLPVEGLYRMPPGG